MTKITEYTIAERVTVLFETLEYQSIYAPDIAPDSETPERERFKYVLPLKFMSGEVSVGYEY